MAVVTLTPVTITEIIEIVDEGAPAASPAPARKPAKKARKASAPQERHHQQERQADICECFQSHQTVTKNRGFLYS